jgi:hypothetical protein
MCLSIFNRLGVSGENSEGDTCDKEDVISYEF